MFRLLTLLALIMFVSSSSLARTWFVGPEGTGAVPSIQNVVDMAASGDTIRIAPGRYNEGKNYSPSWDRFIRVMVMVEELTIIGSGPDQTIIGQEEVYNPDQGIHEGIVGSTHFGNQILRIEDIKFENMFRGIEADSITELFVKNCTFEGNPCGIWGYSDFIFCYNSNFSYESNDFSGAHAVFNCPTKCSISDCSFSGTTTMFGQRSLYIQGCNDAVVDGCNFSGDMTALYLVGGQNTVQSSTFVGQQLAGIYFSGPISESVRVLDCSFENQYTAIETRSSGEIICDNLVIENVTRSSFYIMRPMNNVSIHDCLLAKGEHFVLHPHLDSEKAIAQDGPLHFDMQDNWWGTDNPDSIQAWIFDANDDPDVGYIVEWSPFLSGPVPNDSANLSEIKALFRGGAKASQELGK